MSHYTKENPPVVGPRNGVCLPLSEETFGKTSPLKGQKFWAISPTANNFDDVVKFISEPTAAAIIGRFLRRVGIDIFTDEKNKNTDGTINWSSVVGDWQEFDTGGATLHDLEEQISELQDEGLAIGDLIDSEGLQSDDGSVEEGKQDRYNELTANLKEIGNKIRPLKRQHKIITDKYAAIAAKRQANKATGTVATA
jgi:hypothetical protein